ncbi:DUF4476 domain-containing protein [Pedobacter frigoris]|uniref:DUF4476 domain-containing protein n=1 Tax=Pedobacter frigoris TaxID=2571272 RepID=A0A4U1CF98_9SPHI|nr:DUF4476 domain-containing protein [Pedobacter frigoris]TKC05210.1 DUF4476 domain-containing protein [Pedobacter frigoris]
MKKLTFLAAVLLLTVNAFAQRSSNSKELFIELREPGMYTVYVNDEMAGSAKGRFRFYDVEATAPTITIMENNRQVVKTSLNLESNSRTVVSYDKQAGFRVLKTLPLFSNNQYVLDNWDGSNIQMGRPTDGRPTNGRPSYDGDRPARPAVNYAMSDASFNELLAVVKREDFDANKAKMIKTSLAGNRISTNQLAALVKIMDFDGKKLEVAKLGYDSVIDRQNFFKIYPLFDFSTNKNQLMDYVSKRAANL